MYDSSVDKYNAVHDIVTADINGDGAIDIVTTGEREGCHWYGIPSNPARDIDWKKTLITMSVLNTTTNLIQRILKSILSGILN